MTRPRLTTRMELRFRSIEEITAAAVSETDPTVVYDLRKIEHLNHRTEPAALDIAYLAWPTLAQGAEDIDFTNVMGTNGRLINATGLRVLAYLWAADTTHSLGVAIYAAVTDGYPLMGADFIRTFREGSHGIAWLQNAPTIESNRKLISIATFSEATNVRLAFVFGN